MRSIWKGSISFGLVTIPIKVFSATESHSVSFRQIHTTDGGRIRYRKVCELDEREVPGEEIGKAYEAADGTAVQLTDEDLASLPLPTAKTVEILAFVPAEEIDPIRLDRSYFLSGDGQGASKPYVLLREALERSGKVAIAKFALRGRESLAMVRVYQDTLTLHMMLWPDEIRSAEGMAPSGKVEVRDAELDLADTLMATLGELDTGELHDDYREAMEALVAAKEQGAAPAAEKRAPAEKGKVLDLMSVLESSVQAAKESREDVPGAAAGSEEAESGPGGTVHEMRRKGAAKKKAAPAGKKTASQKAPSGKTAKKSTAAKKAAKKGTAAKQGTAKAGASSGSAGEGGSAGKRAAQKRTPRKSA
ncbi:Ku protein [Streptomyces sp. N2-109]|uniref:Non-homologous end joining protein Ku n=1 Tax=Streptomyces gossypii TaxID=2883101 RepID=A0ABT2JQX8_9ACTN|nr:Ku protein [Streptomyces gossypii]MCT2590292.1 Ku protein [Streptomyces gossypii]